MNNGGAASFAVVYVLVSFDEDGEVLLLFSQLLLEGAYFFLLHFNHAIEFVLLVNLVFKLIKSLGLDVFIILKVY